MFRTSNVLRGRRFQQLLAVLLPVVFGFSSVLITSHFHFDTDTTHFQTSVPTQSCALCKLGVGSSFTAAIACFTWDAALLGSPVSVLLRQDVFSLQPVSSYDSRAPPA